MKVYFIRHGQSEGNRLRLHCGWSDTPLSELGHQQARAANAYLKDIPFDRIYCSDLPRARQTAADALPGCEPIYSDKLREIGVGHLANNRIVDVAAKYGAPYEDVSLKAYLETTEDKVDVSAVEELGRAYLYIASVRMEAEGTEEAFLALLDDLEENEPQLRMRTFSLREDEIHCEIDVYFCGK